MSEIRYSSLTRIDSSISHKNGLPVENGCLKFNRTQLCSYYIKHNQELFSYTFNNDIQDIQEKILTVTH